ncbi:ABC transporter G family member 23-like [Tetranychus urticae]|uniref:ABC transporter domain-containing protein n=1 Tax=Tetranychus urticae TaxID=32264 RepID=T1KK14_TETUR|nr:ABC transporter G family member 23-like [Tetranychus urticae]
MSTDQSSVVNNNNGEDVLNCVEFAAIKANSLKLDLTSFGESNQVFKCLQLTVPSGSIFGLIGPSGCGKTTFFRTILGRYKITSGSLQVLGVNLTKHGLHQFGPEIGYMPQDIALDQDLTVQETLYFYGSLNKLTAKVISHRSHQLTAILGFDNFSRLVSHLSIGQQRRLSLACALLHQPKLALLDEPTVGSDPLLVNKIWDYLKSAQREWKMTVVVSTHYLEEVRRADQFAFLAQGFVLFEDSPHQFIVKSGSFNLEAAISCRYKKEMDNKMKVLTCQPVLPEEKSIKPVNLKIKCNQTFFHVYIWLLWRYYHRWMKHMVYRLIGVGLVHAMIITFCGLLYGHFPKDLSIGIVNRDNGSFAIRYIDLLRENPNHWSFPLYQDERSAHHDIEVGKLQGYLTIGPAFTNNFNQLASLGLSEYIDETLLHSGLITLTQDTVNRLKADSVELTTYIFLHNLIKESVSSEFSDASSYSSDDYLNRLQYVKMEPLFQTNGRLHDLAPTNIVIVKFFFQLVETVTVGMIVLWVTREFHEPTVERLFASGVTRLELACALVTITVLFLSPILFMSCVILTWTTGFPVSGAWLFVALVVPAIIIAGCTKAIWIGSMIPSSTFAILVTTSYGFIGIFIGSIFWPLESLPYFMIPLRNIYPYTESGLSAVRAMIYGDALLTPQVYSGVLYAWAQAFITTLFIVSWFSFSKHVHS